MRPTIPINGARLRFVADGRPADAKLASRQLLAGAGRRQVELGRLSDELRLMNEEIRQQLAASLVIYLRLAARGHIGHPIGRAHAVGPRLGLVAAAGAGAPDQLVPPGSSGAIPFGVPTRMRK